MKLYHRCGELLHEDWRPQHSVLPNQCPGCEEVLQPADFFLSRLAALEAEVMASRRYDPHQVLVRPTCPLDPAHELPELNVKGYSPELTRAALEQAGLDCGQCAAIREAEEKALLSEEERRRTAIRDRDQLWPEGGC